MAKVKYRIREFKPTENQGGSHSFYAEAVINTDITATDLGKVANRTGVKSMRHGVTTCRHPSWKAPAFANGAGDHPQGEAAPQGRDRPRQYRRKCSHAQEPSGFAILTQKVNSWPT